jgi:hypothetical protein
MSSSLGRLEIVEAAVKQAGRSAEFYAHGKLLLRALLRDLALKNRYRCLRKVWGEQTLSVGASSAAFPSDMGPSVEALLFGPERRPLQELDLSDFVQAYGFQPTTQQAARPSAFMMDKEAGVFRFNSFADTAYAFTPIGFKVPADLSLDDADDLAKLWYENDLAIIHGLVWMIFQYTDDAREVSQKNLFDKLDGEYRRGSQPIQSGGQRLKLSTTSFRSRPRR